MFCSPYDCVSPNTSRGTASGCLFPRSRILEENPLFASLLLCGIEPWGNGHFGQIGKLHGTCVHAGNDVGCDVRIRRCEQVLPGYDRDLGLVLLPCLDLGNHMFLHDISGRGLLNDELALQNGKVLAKLLLMLFFGDLLQFFLIGRKALLQDVLYLLQVCVGLLESVKTFCTSTQTICGSRFRQPQEKVFNLSANDLQICLSLP